MPQHDARRRTLEAAPGAKAGVKAGAEPAHLDEISFLAEVAHLAATARTWDELMGTVIDRAKAAARADVCSLYLTDRDGSGLTLAATNGLDQDAVGVARLEMGQGITGLAAQVRSTIVSPDVHVDARFAWIRGVDQARFTSMCSVPLVWDDQVVGVLNVQTVEPREFTPARLALPRDAGGAAGRARREEPAPAEAEAQLESLRAIDEARANLVAVVTHALRTPLAVVRAYVELLGGQARIGRQCRGRGLGARGPGPGRPHRPDGRLDPREPARHALARPPSCCPSTSSRVVSEVTTELAADAALARPRVHLPRRAARGPGLRRRCSTACWATCSRTPPSTRRPSGRIDIYGWRDGDRARLAVTDDGPGIPEPWRERIFEPFVRLDDSPRGAGIGLFAARHLARSMGGELSVEPREPHGSQFVLRAAPSSVQSG